MFGRKMVEAPAAASNWRFVAPSPYRAPSHMYRDSTDAPSSERFSEAADNLTRVRSHCCESFVAPLFRRQIAS